MYQLDEKIMADNRAIISIARNKEEIEKDLKPGMFVYDSFNRDAYVVASKNVHHKLIKEQDDKKIHGNLVFADKIEFENGISILGDITNVETVDLLVSDNIIEINKDEMSSGISRLSAGVKINRGLLPHYYTLFNEQSDRSGLGVYTHVIGEDALSKLYSDGSMWLKNSLDVVNLRARQDIIADKNATIRGNAQFNQTVVIDGTTDIKGSTTIDNSLNVAGAVAVSNTLDVQLNATMNQNLTVGRDLTVKNNSYLSGSIDIAGDITVAGQSQFNGNVFAHALDVLNSTTMQGSLSVKGISSFQSTINALSDLNVSSGLTVGGASKLNTLNVQSSATFSGLTTFNDIVNITSKLNTTILNVGSTSTFGGKATFSTDVTIQNDLDVTGITYLNDLIVRTNASLTGNLTAKDIFATNVTTSGNLTVNSDASFLKNISVSANASILGHGSIRTLSITGSSRFDGAATFTESATFNSPVTMSNNLSVSKAITAQDVNINNQLNFSNGYLTYKTYTIDKSLFDINNASLAVASTNAQETIKHIIGDKTVSEQSLNEVRFATPIKVKTNNEWSTVLDEKTGHSALHAADGTDPITPFSINAVGNGGAIATLRAGTFGDMGAPNPYGEIYCCPDTKSFYYGKGKVWEKISAAVDWSEILNKPETYTPPVATKTTLGGVKIGTNIKLQSDGTISVPNAVIEYNVHRKEFVTTRSTDTFVTDVEFIPNSNLISVYVFGKILPPSAYKETDKHTIVLKEAVEANTHVEIVALVIPSGSLFSFKREEFFAVDNQVDFILSDGQFLVGENKVKVYVFGALLPPSAYDEVSYDRIRLKAPVEKGTHVMIEYLSDPEISTSRMSYKQSINYLQQSSTVDHPIYETYEERTVWEIVHNRGAYIPIIPLTFEGYQLKPENIQYVNSNIIRIYFNNPTSGRVMVG